MPRNTLLLLHKPFHTTQQGEIPEWSEVPNQHKGDNEILRDLRNTACMALLFAEGRTRNDFSEDPQLLLAVVKAIEIVGEAAQSVSDRRREGDMPEHEALPDTEWRQVIGMRGKLAHMSSVDGIDASIIWQTVQEDLPPLIALLERAVPPPAAG